MTYHPAGHVTFSTWLNMNNYSGSLLVGQISSDMGRTITSDKKALSCSLSTELVQEGSMQRWFYSSKPRSVGLCWRLLHRLPYTSNDNLRKKTKTKKHERKKENKWATESNASNIMAQLINRTEGNLPLSEPRQRSSTPSLSALIWLACVCVCVFIWIQE